MGREYEPNVEFDLSLRPSWVGPSSAAMARQLDELALQFVLAGDAEDSVRLPGELPGDFLASMERNQLIIPRVTARPAIRSEQTFTPFGWNRAAIELNHRYDAPAPHPPFETVRRVNGRSFAADVEQELVGSRYQIGEFDSVAAVTAAMESTDNASLGWMVKSNHGNSGMGNRRLRRRELTDTDRRWLRSTLAEDDGVVLEPWCRRVADLCVTFELGSDGCVSDLAAHEIVNTSDGAFLGALFEPCSETIAKWQVELGRVANLVANRLTKVGYFGPVSFDSYVWANAARHRLRPLSDLNARCHMSMAARRLWHEWECGRVVYWRMFSCRKLRLPEHHDLMERELGRGRFDLGSRCGVLVASPLRVSWEGRRRCPRRLGVLFVGRSRDEVLERERRFRERFER